MLRPPLYYSDTIIGTACVDDGLLDLLSIYRLSIRIPKKIRDIAPGRPDVIIAILKEDEYAFRRIRPIICTLDTQIYLVNVVLRPAINDLLLARSFNPGEVSHSWAATEYKRLTSDIRRVFYEDNNRTNCQLSNLREASKDLSLDSPNV